MPLDVDYLDVSTYKVSLIPGKNVCLASFSFNGPVQAYSVNLLGVSHDTGTLLDYESKSVANLAGNSVVTAAGVSVKDTRAFDAGLNFTTQIEGSELYQEGENRINIYGQDADTGVWMTYQS